jgi:inward rectifier potassium channel
MDVMNREKPQRASASPDIDSDLGFGSVVARESRKRFLNRDGTFNVRREGLNALDALSPYHFLLTLSWPRFLAATISLYVVTNALFAAVYTALGDGALSGAEHLDTLHRYGKAFFFSVHTLATIGYGNVYPSSLAADIVVALESLVGLLGFAVVAGIVFARFARPVARIVFSDKALVAPYRDGKTAFMFRIVNQRSNQLVELETKVLLSRRRKNPTGGMDRDFMALKLERDRVVFFPLAWTIVHPIDETSPLFGATADDLREWDAEFLVLLNGFDETFSQTVHTRSSYKADEVVWGAKYRSMFLPPTEDGIAVDVRKIHDFEKVSG